MDLNDFIFRDDHVEPLGAGIAGAEDQATSEEPSRFVTPVKIGLAVVGGALLGMSHFLGHGTRHF